MAYQSKYTGLQIDDILDSVEWKQGKIEDLASIRAGAQKGATALQSYTEKYTGTVTGIKINGVVKSGSGVIDLGTISTDISGKQDKLVDGVNIATINGQSLTAGGDLTIESGAKVYELDLADRGENGSITEEEWNILKDVDTLKIKLGFISYLVHKTSDDVFTALVGAGVRLFSSLEMTGFAGEENRPIFSALTFIFTGPTYDPPLTYQTLATVTPTKTSELENDSDFVTSEDVAAVALSGSYNDLQDTPTIPSAVTESTVSGWGFTKNAGTITGVSANGTSIATSGVANIPAASTSAYGVTKLSSSTSSTSTSLAATASAVKAAYDLANSYKGTVTGVKINGTTKNPSSGVVDLGTVITAHQDISGKQDKLVSGTNIKTINGTSILGSGNITISGGSSSGGSGAYSEVNHGTSDTTFALTPNTFHVWDEVENLTLTLGSEISSVANEYLFQFTSGSTATTLSLPSDLKWAEELVVEPNRIYQVSILKGLASVLSWENAPEIEMISFSCMIDSLKAEAGMTWNEWINSSYNNGKYSTDGELIIRNGDLHVTYQGSVVYGSEKIIDGAFYNTEPM